MLNDYLQIHAISIVFLGDFNPKIIQPFWLVNKKLIREQEGTEAKIEVIHPDLVKFSLGWVDFEITKERFMLNTSQEPYFSAVKDLASSIFSILKETPIKNLGINHLMHYTLRDEKQYFEFGNKLVPLSQWNNFIKDPKMLQLQIIERKRQDGDEGYYRIGIQPSDLLFTVPFSLSISFNDHFAIKKDSSGRELEMVKKLNEKWTESKEKAMSFVEKIWEIVNT
jgi:hypothetical protein